jgi:poly-gamma-glutamate system protein
MHSRYPYRSGTLPNRVLVLTLFCVLLALVLVEAHKRYWPDALNQEKVAAARLMQQSINIVKAEKIRAGIEIDPLVDIHRTGMIGPRYNDLTTTVGSLASKRTSTNPAFAAAVVEMLDQVGAQRGDPVAVSFSSSFPALNIAVLSALRALGLEPVIVSSVGASMYGASDPGMTWLDMESLLTENRVFSHRSAAASLGGIVDTQGGIDGTGIGLGLEAIQRNHVPLLQEGGAPAQRHDIRNRLDLYDRALHGVKPVAFINVGASQTALGSSPEVYRLAPGLLKNIPVTDDPDRGIIFHMSERGIPVIHLLKIRSLARQFNIPFDPVPLPQFVHGSTITGARHSKPVALMALLALLAIMACGKYYGRTKVSAGIAPHPVA